MKKEYITPQTLVMCVEPMVPIAASGDSASGDFNVTIIEDEDDYNGVFYSPVKPNSLWEDDEE